MARTGISLIGRDLFPAGVRDVKRLLKQSVVQRQRVGARIGMSHFKLIYWKIRRFQIEIAFNPQPSTFYRVAKRSIIYFVGDVISL
jgi:hypothetical protein